jgi:ABC-type transport system involved in multi-copper enzyme maturation permease subunit
MNAAALRCLFVKEAREQGWAIPALFAVEYSVVMLAVDRDSGLAALSFALMGVVPLAAILLGINIGAGEASRGTLEFLQAQPIS